MNIQIYIHNSISMSTLFFENSILLESFRRDWWKIDIYFKDQFFLFYFYLKEHKNRPWICIWKLKKKNDWIKNVFSSFKKDDRCQRLKDYLIHYSWDLKDDKWFRNLSYHEYKRYINQLNEWIIKSAKEFKQIKTYLRWKRLKDII